MTGLVLHDYFRSSSSIRLRAALNLKGLSYDQIAHHLRKGEQRDAAYLAINPQGLVPALVLEDGAVLTQSLAIIEYLDEIHPSPSLLPKSALDRARVRALAHAVALDIHPVNNLRVLAYLRSAFDANDDSISTWFRHWVAETFKPLEAMLVGDSRTGRFCHGDTPGLADLCLYAQVLNNSRFGVVMSPYPIISRIFEVCAIQPAFAAAAPDKQPDAE
jgi:maleylpyruvate isomerase